MNELDRGEKRNTTDFVDGESKQQVVCHLGGSPQNGGPPETGEPLYFGGDGNNTRHEAGARMCRL